MKPVQIIVYVTITILFSSCEDKDKLFELSSEGDLLYMAESTNVERLSADSLQLYLTPFELRILDTTITKFKNVGKIIQKPNYKLIVLLQETNAEGRAYEFLIRTYKNDWTFIDSYQIGIWNEKLKYFCYGSIGKDLKIDKKCEDDQNPDEMQIREDGKIVRRAPKQSTANP
jgi:hypothetical protein